MLCALLAAGSLVVSFLLLSFGIPFFFVFLFLPLIPFFGRDTRIKRCPICGWETSGDELYCPYDGTPLA